MSTNKTVGVSGLTSKNIIPEYAREYKREYQFIRSINKECAYFLSRLDELNNGLFESKTTITLKNNIKKFLRGQEKGKFKDISKLILPVDEVENLIIINGNFKYYKLHYDKQPYSGFIEIYDIFKLFFDQIKYEGCIYKSNIYSDSDSGSGSDSDSDSDSDIKELDLSYTDSDLEDFCNQLNSFFS